MIMLQDLSLAMNHGKTMISKNVLHQQFFTLLWFVLLSFFSCYIYFVIAFPSGAAFWKIGSHKVLTVPKRLVEERQE